MDYEAELIDKFYAGFSFYIIIAFVFIAMLIVVLAFRKRFLKAASEASNSKAVYWVIVGITALFIAFFAFKSVCYFMDLKIVKDRNFEKQQATVIGYSYMLEGNDPEDPILGKPVFKISNTGETITLNTGPVEFNQTYWIIYLKHSKIGVIIS